MAANASVDGFFGFVDKHLTKIAVGVALLVAYKTIQSTVPTDEDKAAQEQSAAQLDVNARLQPPPVPAKDKDGNLNKAAEMRYNVALKAHRSALYAQRLWDAMHTTVGFLDLGNFDGTDERAILTTAYDIAVARITLPQLRADYLALQTHYAHNKGLKYDLLADLKAELSAADYLTFMQRIGLSPAQAYAVLHPKPKK